MEQTLEEHTHIAHRRLPPVMGDDIPVIRGNIKDLTDSIPQEHVKVVSESWCIERITGDVLIQVTYRLTAS